jgi:hypothetical protein
VCSKEQLVRHDVLAPHLSFFSSGLMLRTGRDVTIMYPLPFYDTRQYARALQRVRKFLRFKDLQSNFLLV